MNKQEIVKTFCTVLKDFLSDIYNSYPDNSLLLLQQATNAMILADPSSVVENFMTCIEPYTNKILSKDESFFLDGGLESELATGEYSFLLEELKKISNIWKNPETSDKTKKSIWKYLQILVKLGKNLKE
jgi:hypothetical protein